MPSSKNILVMAKKIFAIVKKSICSYQRDFVIVKNCYRYQKLLVIVKNFFCQVEKNSSFLYSGSKILILTVVYSDFARLLALGALLRHSISVSSSLATNLCSFLLLHSLASICLSLYPASSFLPPPSCLLPPASIPLS